MSFCIPTAVHANPSLVPHIFQAEQWIDAPVERVFRFFADPHNLSVISPPSSGVRLKSLHLVPPALLGVVGAERLAGKGSEITISFRLLPYFPIRGSWTARIIEFEWLHRFRDLQVNGPFESFDHTHSFSESRQSGKSGTVIHDHVVYQVGVGPFGIIANGLFVRSMLKQMFAYRHMATARELAGS